MQYDVNFIRKNLINSEYEELKEINTLSDADRQQKLKDFFHKDFIFNRFKPIVDPTWLAYFIFINKRNYEF